MKSKTVILLCVLGFGLFIYGLHQYVLTGPRSPLLGFSKEVQKAYDSIKMGESFAEVEKRLGSPVKSGDKLLLPQTKGFEAHFEAAEQSEAVIYYLWVNGGNWFYSIGFDAEESTVIKAEGNS